MLRAAGTILRQARPLLRARVVLAAPPTAGRLSSVGGARRFGDFTITFVKGEDGSETTVPATAGQTILTVAHDNNIDIEGACGGECACSTCHIVLDQEAYNKMPEPDEDEADMLDLAANVCETSRLGCQIKLVKERDQGLRITIPEGNTNLLS